MSLLATLKQKLFRWQSDGTAPLRLGQRRIFIIPNRGGLLFAMALIVMLIGAINYTLALGHALVFLLAGLGLSGMMHTFRNLHGLIITPGRCEPVFAGDLAHFNLTLGNERVTPRLALELAASNDHAVITEITAQSSTQLAIPLPTLQRGWLELPKIRLSTQYPLGLFTAWSYLQPAMRCLVYPQPLTTPLPLPVASSDSGEQRGDGGQDDFAGFRDRQPADSPRHIAWKASARNDHQRPLLVKLFAGGAQMELILAWSMTDAALDNETRIAILTGWVLAAEEADLSYGLDLPGSHLAPDHGAIHLRRSLELLALFQA